MGAWHKEAQTIPSEGGTLLRNLNDRPRAKA
jgi:hypothetical protein